MSEKEPNSVPHCSKCKDPFPEDCIECPRCGWGESSTNEHTRIQCRLWKDSPKYTKVNCRFPEQYNEDDSCINGCAYASRKSNKTGRGEDGPRHTTRMGQISKFGPYPGSRGGYR